MFQGFNYYMNNIDRGGRQLLGVNSLSNYISTGYCAPIKRNNYSRSGLRAPSARQNAIKNTKDFLTAVVGTSVALVAVAGLKKGFNSGLVNKIVSNAKKSASTVVSSGKKAGGTIKNLGSKIANLIKKPPKANP